MSDSYQAIYDAVRSRISGGNVADSMERVARDAFDMSYVRSAMQEQAYAVGNEMQRPSVLFRPDLIQDGDGWLAIYGDLPTGVVGTGKTPAEAMSDFDASWLRPARLVSA